MAPELPDDRDHMPSWDAHRADATLVRIAERLLAVPPDDAIWQEAAALNAAKRPLDAAYGRGEITRESYQERLRLVAGSVLARPDQTAAEIFMAATLLLLAEAAATPRPGCPN
jgi:hypothetical protein